MMMVNTILNNVKFVCFAILFATFIASILYFISASSWHDLIDDTAPALTFEAFRKLYALNPKKWSLSYDYVVYCDESDGRYNSQRVEFTRYYDVIKYRIFHDKIEKGKQELERINNEKEFLKHVQHDIDAYRRENIEEMEKRLQK